MRRAGVDVVIFEEEGTDLEEAEMFVDAFVVVVVLARVRTCYWYVCSWSVVRFFLSYLPVGFHFMIALKRPIVSSSVHGSDRMSSGTAAAAAAALLGDCDCKAGGGVLGWWLWVSLLSVAMGEAAWETRARFLGGIFWLVVVVVGCWLVR